MSSTYTGNPANVTPGNAVSLTIPADGDVVNASSATTPEDAGADYLEYLYRMIELNEALQLNPATTPAAINYLTATGFGAGVGPTTAACGTNGAIYTSNYSTGQWTTVTSVVGAFALNMIASNGSLLVAVGALNSTNPAICTSANGSTFTARSNTLVLALNAVVWSPGLSLWCAVGASGAIITSPDAITWTVHSSGAATFDDVIWGVTPALFLAPQSGSVTYRTSPDGTTWTARTFPVIPGAGAHRFSYAPSSGLFVAAGSSDNKIYTSPDGINWTARFTMPGSAGSIIPYICVVGRMVLAVAAGYVAASWDGGLTWRSYLGMWGGSGNAVLGTIPIPAAANSMFMLATGGTAHGISNILIRP